MVVSRDGTNGEGTISEPPAVVGQKPFRPENVADRVDDVVSARRAYVYLLYVRRRRGLWNPRPLGRRSSKPLDMSAKPAPAVQTAPHAA